MKVNQHSFDLALVITLFWYQGIIVLNADWVMGRPVQYVERLHDRASRKPLDSSTKRNWPQGRWTYFGEHKKTSTLGLDVTVFPFWFIRFDKISRVSTSISGYSTASVDPSQFQSGRLDFSSRVMYKDISVWQHANSARIWNDQLSWASLFVLTISRYRHLVLEPYSNTNSRRSRFRVDLTNDAPAEMRIILSLDQSRTKVLVSAQQIEYHWTMHSLPKVNLNMAKANEI